MTGLILVLYKINWYIFTIYSNMNDMENVYYLYRFHFKETTMSYLTVYILHWCILAIHSCMIHSESVDYLHESRNEKLIESIHSFYNGIWLCKSLILRQNFCFCLYNNLLFIPIMQACPSQGHVKRIYLCA